MSVCALMSHMIAAQADLLKDGRLGFLDRGAPTKRQRPIIVRLGSEAESRVRAECDRAPSNQRVSSLTFRPQLAPSRNLDARARRICAQMMSASCLSPFWAAFQRVP